MSEELYFNDELRKCLNAAGLSDCGENDAWNYWYQRVYKAHNQTIDRVTEVQRSENDKLREQLEYEHQTSRSRLERIDQLKDENTKLRELCNSFAEYVSQDRCEGCVLKRRCDDGEIEECWQRTEIRNEAHRIGIEVD